MIENYTVTKEIEICPKCGIFGLADGVCDYCGYDRITEYVESRIRKEEARSLEISFDIKIER